VIPAGGQFFSDSKRILFQGHEPGHADRLYVTTLDGGQPRPITAEGYGVGSYPHSITSDDKRIAAVTSDGIALVSVDGGDPQPVRGSQAGEAPIRWTKDEKALLIGKRGETSCTVSRLDLSSGARTDFKTVHPADLAGVVGVSCPRLAADEEHYVFGYTRNLSDLFLVEHLK
jgi:Tol biopolymer transport system component